jgi:hypothetical protein
MSLKQNSKFDFVIGFEGSKIKQYFDPHDSLNEM